MILSSYYRLVSFDKFTYICSQSSICYCNKNKLLLITTLERMHNWHTCKREHIHAQMHIEAESQTVEKSVLKTSLLVTQMKQSFKLWAAKPWSASLCYAVRCHYMWIIYINVGRDSVVGIATRYGLEGPGIESRWGRDFPHLSRPALGPTQPPVIGYRVFPEGKGGRGVMLTTHPLLVPRSWKSRAIPLLLLWARVACYKVKPYLTLPYDS
jgi:hypothetical protein